MFQQFLFTTKDSPAEPAPLEPCQLLTVNSDPGCQQGNCQDGKVELFHFNVWRVLYIWLMVG
jgi:hypothetical protein